MYQPAVLSFTKFCARRQTILMWNNLKEFFSPGKILENIFHAQKIIKDNS